MNDKDKATAINVIKMNECYGPSVIEGTDPRAEPAWPVMQYPRAGPHTGTRSNTNSLVYKCNPPAIVYVFLLLNYMVPRYLDIWYTVLPAP